MAGRTKTEYRYYDMPRHSFALPLLGASWRRPYQQDADNLHFHNYMEIGFCLEGTGTLYFDERACAYRPGVFTLIPPNYLHATLSENGSTSYWEYLFVDVEGLLAKMYGDGSERAAQMSERIYRGAMFLNQTDDEALARLVLAIMEEYRAEGDMYLECAENMLRALLVQVARLHNAATKKSVPHGHNHLAIVKALQYVQKNYMHRIRIEDLAAACSLSETHFRRVFNEYMHMAPLNYVNLVRIEMACKLLRTTNEAINDIAMRCGFTTITSFNRNFKEIIGITPFQWRKDTAYYERKLDAQNVLAFHGWL